MRTFTLRICPALLGLFFAGSAAAAPSSFETRARQALLAREPALALVTLEHRLTQALPGGRTLVRFAQSHAGLPVLGRGASALLDAAGHATSFIPVSVEDRFPSSSVATVGAASAAQAAEHAVRGAGFVSSDARLAWLPGPRGARLVWLLYRGAIPGTPVSPLVAIDAQSGALVLRVDATRYDRLASVFEQNPVKTPEPKSVTLDTLAPGATKLESAQIQSLTCVDTKALVSQLKIHMCELQPKALADASGDFVYPWVSDTAPEDELAEVSMFYHASRGYAFFESLGMPKLLLQPLVTVANLRFPAGWDKFDLAAMKDVDTPLEPYDNAFFSPDKPFYGLFGTVPGGLFFGQGTQADFAYDGDVVYHELGHAMIDSTIQLVFTWHFDTQGVSPQPGAMNEGLADYFSSALTGDGKVGEYAVKNVAYGYAGESAIRDLDNDHSCPKNIAGEVHADSTLFSGGLWKVRQSLPEADRNTYDTALMTALIGAPSGDVGYADVAKLFVSALGASTLGSTVASALQTEFEIRGVLPECARLLEYTSEPLSSADWKLGNSFYAPGRPYVGLDSSAPYVPGLLQVHRKLPADAVKLRVAWTDVPYPPQLHGNDITPYTPAVLVRFDKEPIVFDAGVATNALGPFPVTQGFAPHYEIEIPKGATDAWVMVVNQGDEQGLYRELSLQTKAAPTHTGGTGGKPGTGGTTATGGNSATGTGGATSDEPLGLHAVGGCNASEREAPPWSAFGWLALAGLLARMRRTRGRAGEGALRSAEPRRLGA